LRTIFRKSYNLSAYNLIAKLNPIIRGWSNYFNKSQSYRARTSISYFLYTFIWNWARHKHPKWGKKRIARFYFLSDNPIEKTVLRSTSGNTRKWIFRGKTFNPSIYKDNQEGKTIELLEPTIVVDTISARRYCLPDNLGLIHAYHPEFHK